MKKNRKRTKRGRSETVPQKGPNKTIEGKKGQQKKKNLREGKGHTRDKKRKTSPKNTGSGGREPELYKTQIKGTFGEYNHPRRERRKEHIRKGTELSEIEKGAKRFQKV